MLTLGDVLARDRSTERPAIGVTVEVALRPVTDVAENVIGVLGGDWLSEQRRLNREKLKAKTDEKLRKANVKNAAPPSPSIALPLLSHAQDESREDLLDLWAKLLAAACDPGRSNRVRRDFIDVVKGLSRWMLEYWSACARFRERWAIPLVFRC